MNKRILMAAMLGLVVLTGCGSAKSSSMDTVANESVYGGYGGYEEAEVAPSEAITSDYIKNTDRKLIKTVDISTETENFDEFMAIILEKVNEAGGYVQEINESGKSGYRYSNLTIRIPKANVDDFLGVITDNTNVTYRREAVEDVTLQYVDLDSHKKMLKTEETRLLELLEKAESVSDIITIESELTNVRYQIESMESQLRTMENQIDFSTINLNVDEVVRYSPQEELSTWGRIKTGFVSNWLDLVDAVRDLFVEFVIHIPNLILAAIVITIIVVVVKKLKRNKKKDKKEL